MCKHEEIVLASRNAIVGAWSALSVYDKFFASLELKEELARRENAYDALLEDLAKECKSCEADFKEANHACFEEVCYHITKRDFLLFVDDFVLHFGGKKCGGCL